MLRYDYALRCAHTMRSAEVSPRGARAAHKRALRRGYIIYERLLL